MHVGRRTLLGAGAGLVSAAVGAAAAEPAGGKPPMNVSPFVETRGAPSADPAPAADAIAANTVNVRYSDLPEATVRAAKLRVLDLIGCAIGGAPDPGNAALVDVLRVQGAKPEASVIGFPLKTSAVHAATANATIARSFDFEVMTVVVGDRLIGSHNSPTTCMTALALCQAKGLSGQDFITALTVGDDLGARLLAASGLNLGLGWDGAEIYSALPAAAIAARLLGLSAGQTRDALGLTVDTICGTNQNTWDSAMDWKLSQGHAARNGIFAAELAKRGWVGIGDPLLSGYGFFSQFTAGCEHPAILTDGLGRTFYAEGYFKPYPACAASHTSIECALAIRANNRLSPSDVEKVTVAIAPASLTSTLAQKFRPSRYSHCGANFNIQFQVANALLHGSVRQEHYAETALRAPELQALLEKTSLIALPKGETGVDIEIVDRAGRTLREHHSGVPNRYPNVDPMTPAEVVAKFRQQAAFSGFLPEATGDEMIRRVDALENERDMADFARLVTSAHLA